MCVALFFAHIESSCSTIQIQLRVSVMHLMHGFRTAEASPNASPYAPFLELDYDGFIAVQDIIRAKKLMVINRSLLTIGVSFLGNFHATDAWIRATEIVRRTIFRANKMPGLSAGHDA